MLPSPPAIIQQGLLRATSQLWRGTDQRLRLTVCVGATFDMVHGKPSQLSSTQLAPSCDAPQKQRVDVVVHAAAPAAAATEQHHVSASVGAMTKSLTIAGDRRWVVGPGAAAQVPSFEPLTFAAAAARAQLTLRHRQWLEYGMAAGEAMPVDFGVGFFNVAPTEQQLDHFEGAQRLLFTNLHPNTGHFETTIQVPSPMVKWQVAGGAWPHFLAL